MVFISFLMVVILSLIALTVVLFDPEINVNYTILILVVLNQVAVSYYLVYLNKRYKKKAISFFNKIQF